MEFGEEMIAIPLGMLKTQGTNLFLVFLCFNLRVYFICLYS